MCVPTSTFFNLTEAKKQRLLTAAHAEFSRVPLHEASINRIIQQAKISRGSFYQYFSDKMDLFGYDFIQVHKRQQDDFYQTLIAVKGDFFLAIRTFIDKNLIDFTSGSENAYFRNVFLSLSFTESQRLRKVIRNKHPHGQINELIDRTKIRVTDDESLQQLVHLITSACFQTIGRYCQKNAQTEQFDLKTLRQDLLRVLDWLENGVVRKTEGA
ncbi:hypothetical protein B8A32_09990 [Loigolactobacillus backii]|nr:hypothetical protein B8A32_09990 [Loigolactobacillus backii]